MGALEITIDVASNIARADALVDAEKLVRERAGKTKWPSDARLLNLAADAIRELRNSALTAGADALEELAQSVAPSS